MKTLKIAFVAVAINAIICSSSAQAVEINWPEPNWPDIFEPNQLLTLNLEMAAADWNLIKLDGLIWNDVNQAYEVNSANPLPYEIEVPAWFWMEGEEANKIVVAVRQKSCDPLGDANDRYFKISLKIDINQYEGIDPNAASNWHDLKKLSLENADDMDPIAEGMACNMHNMGSGPLGYDYGSGAYYANWAKLYVNGVYRGVYVNQEQRDKTFMQHRDSYVHGETWLYQHTGGDTFEIQVADDEHPTSPAVKALCYVPFVCQSCGVLTPPGVPPACPTPTDANLVASVDEWVEIRGLLAMEAINAFVAQTDGLFTHYQNVFFLDYNLPDPCETRKRKYFAWDQDSSLGQVDMNIYNYNNTNWQQVILGNPTFRSQYNQILRDLLDPNGPLSEANIHAFLDDVNTPELRAALAADRFNQFDSPGEAGVIERFIQIKSWISDRIDNVLGQVDFDEPTLPPGIILLQDGFEGAIWDANWVAGHNWQSDPTTYAHGAPAAKAPEESGGYFTCNALDTSDASAIHIDFWFQKDNTDEVEDIILSYYNGTGYVDVCDLGTLGANDEWLHYTHTIADSNFFVSNFQIRFNATPEKKENVWVDDVVITKETPPTISGHILDPGATPVEAVTVDANNAGGSDTTDPNGYYELQVPFGWSGSVTPTKTDYTFNPTSKAYSNLITDHTNQDYEATSIYDLYPDGVIDWRDLNV
ncbi:MAG: CotH kinase family protein, partial [Planctomycetota bacterium]